MKRIKPNIYYFQESGELLTAVEAFLPETALNEFIAQGFDSYDFIIVYDQTFERYGYMFAGDIAIQWTKPAKHLLYVFG